MAYCPNCGNPVSDEAKFCSNCSHPLKNGLDEGARRIVREGTVHKCPNCGENVSSFTASCPSCGFEFRDSRSSTSLTSFVSAIANASSSEQKVDIIRTFPIPNTKEDIIEYMVTASTNISGEQQQRVQDAWKVKLDQAYHKAKLVISSPEELGRVHNIYELTQKEIRRTKFANQTLPVLPQLIIIGVWIISLFILLVLSTKNLDVVGTNAFQMLYIIDLIVGAVVIPSAISGKSKLPRLVAAAGLALTILVLTILSTRDLDVVGTNAFQMLLIIELICAGVILARAAKKIRNGQGD